MHMDMTAQLPTVLFAGSKSTQLRWNQYPQIMVTLRYFFLLLNIAPLTPYRYSLLIVFVKVFGLAITASSGQWTRSSTITMSLARTASTAKGYHICCLQLLTALLLSFKLYSIHSVLSCDPIRAWFKPQYHNQQLLPYIDCYSNWTQ